jgi:inner membrane transporter RhtA
VVDCADVEGRPPGARIVYRRIRRPLQAGERIGEGAGRLWAAAGRVPPTGLVLAGIVSVQVGAAIAKGLFDTLGPGGIVFLRIAFAALILLLLWRPKIGGYSPRSYLTATVFGLALAGMNFSIYLAFDRIPLGVAVTLEFVGPLAVAIV